MTKPFAAFDIDGTIFKSSLVEKTTEQCIQNGLFCAEPFNEVYVKRRQWQVSNNEGSYQAYLHSLVEGFVQQIKDVSAEQMDAIAQEVVAEHQVRCHSFPYKLFKALRVSHYMVAITGSPKFIGEAFLSNLKFDAIYGSFFEQQNGVFTGNARVVGDKAEILRNLINQGTVQKLGSVAIGDTISDKSMLELADHPIMFNPSRTLTNYGRSLGWSRVIELKDQITAMQYDPSAHAYVETDPNDLIDDLIS